MLWRQDDIAKFDFEIEKEDCFQFDIKFRLIYNYAYKNLRYKVLLEDESGHKTSKELTRKVIQTDGSYDGEVLGDFVDITDTYISDTILPKGKYYVSIQQKHTKGPLPYVGEVGISVSKFEK